MKLFILAILTFCSAPLAAQTSIPYLQKKGSSTQLIVHDKPYLILGGELGNSSATSMEYMEPIWPKLKAMNLNTVLAPVFWELIEPVEGEFDFSLLDTFILEARNQDLKIILLWFGAWKNSMSSHAPSWVKLDQDRFPRIKDNTGRSHEILTPFNSNNLESDRKAFTELIKHLKEVDSEEHTVIMVQVENEIGMLPTARDYHSLANKAFNEDVPKELIRYISSHELVPEFEQSWEVNGAKKSGSWEDIFGKSTRTDEYFMAWYYAEFTNKLVLAGKEIYPLPMFVNAALPRPGSEPGISYPSAGPLPHLMDIWKAAAPEIDFLAPDFYNPDFQKWNDLYTRQGDPLFVPEHRFDETVDAKALYTFAHYEGLGFSPFSIESVNDAEDQPLGKMYSMIDNLSDLITKYQGTGVIKGILFDKEHPEEVIQLGEYEFSFKHDYTLGWDPNSSNKEWPLAAGIIIQTGLREYIIAGNGIVTRITPTGKPESNAGILSAEEGRFENGEWIRRRRMNGDQIHQGRHIRIPFGRYAIQQVEFYTYD